MRVLLTIFFTLSSTSALTWTVSRSEECAACLFAVHSFKTVSSNSSDFLKLCASIDGCNVEMTHCNVVDGLPKLPVVESARFVAGLHELVKSARTLCLQDRKLAVLSGDAIKCTLCSLVESILHFFNDAVLGGKFEADLLHTITNVCSSSIGIAIREFCLALFGEGAFNDIFQGLRDSLGPFYNIVGVQGLGCPPIEKLGTICFSP
uniref:Saposin B-type domain-containing protein n=1 Tax=Steinernema glaseri TaxID=37863 RepID=A0A1I8A9Q9_9BILA